MVIAKELYNIKFTVNIPSELYLIKNTKGVYVITIDTREQYVGSSLRMRKRILQHLAGPELCDAVNIDIYETNYENMLILERQLISELKPTLNTFSGTLRESERHAVKIRQLAQRNEPKNNLLNMINELFANTSDNIVRIPIKNIDIISNVSESSKRMILVKLLAGTNFTIKNIDCEYIYFKRM